MNATVEKYAHLPSTLHRPYVEFTAPQYIDILHQMLACIFGNFCSIENFQSHSNQRIHCMYATVWDVSTLKSHKDDIYMLHIAFA